MTPISSLLCTPMESMTPTGNWSDLLALNLPHYETLLPSHIITPNGFPKMYQSLQAPEAISLKKENGKHDVQKVNTSLPTFKKKRVRPLCEELSCSKYAQSQGKCKRHGGGKRCSVDGCSKSSQGNNLCRSHGGGERCSREGCDKGAQYKQLCGKHGGGRRCRVEECDKHARGGGLCQFHGNMYKDTLLFCSQNVI